jgi:osmotically-inducible protein OsmY
VDTDITRIEQQLREQHHAAVAVAEHDGAILLSGRVPSKHDRAAIERMARDLSGGLPVVNLIEVEQTASGFALDETSEETEEDNTPVEDLGDTALDALLGDGDDAGDNEDGDELLDPSIEAVPLDTNAIDAMGDDEYDALDAPEDDPAYFAPTDPVLGRNAAGEIEVVGGFAPTSMVDEAVAPSAEDRLPGDEALADAVRRELREDASTTTLVLDVQVERGVVHLRGAVPDLEDAENAESVASTVPGVRDVIDETDVQGL